LKRGFLYTWILIVIIVLTSACGNKQQTDDLLPNDYEVTLIADAGNPHRLLFDLKGKETGAPSTLEGRTIHALIVPQDLGTLYHDHPAVVRAGRYELLLDYLPGDGLYDVWLVIVVGSEHHSAFYKRFPVRLTAGPGQSPTPVSSRVALSATPTEGAVSRQSSRLSFGIALDGKPPAAYGKFKDVSVHAFAVSMDREFLVYDHAETLRDGVVRAAFSFPTPGQYVIFLQPTVITDGADLRQMLRHELTVQ